MNTSKFKTVVLIAIALLNCLLPFCWSSIGAAFHLSPMVTGMGSAVHEFVASVLSFFLLRSIAQTSKARWLQTLRWSLLFVGIADLTYGVTANILQIPPPRGLIPLVHELPYVAFALLSAYAVLLRALEGLNRRAFILLGLFATSIASIHFAVSYELILKAFFAATPARPLAIYITSGLYALGQSVFVGGVMLATVRSYRLSEFLMWSLFLVMAASDFLLRYQDIGGPIAGLSFFEYGWELAFAGIASLLLVERFISKQTHALLEVPAPMFSLRMIIASVTLGALLAFAFATSWFLSFLHIATPQNAGFYTLLLTFFWTLSNVLSLSVSHQLRRLHSRLVAHSILQETEIPAMTSEISTIFSFLHGRNLELYKERDKAIAEAHQLKTESAIHALTHKIMHDVKAPISTLVLMLETDLKDIPAHTKDKIRQLAGRIRSIIDFRLKQYSQDAIGFTRQPDEAPKPIETASIGGAVHWILEEEQEKAKARGVNLVCDLPRTVLNSFAAITFSDFCRVISNLLINAIDAAEKGGKRVYITARVDDENCELIIRDSGLGFDPEALKEVLANRKITTKETGTGLGLITVRSLLAQAGGDLQIHSQANGTTVRLHIPILDTPQWFYDISKSSADSIVALDDDATMKKRLEAVFPEKQIQLFATESEFLATLQNSASALALVDYDFGGPRSGLDLIVAEGLTRNAVLLSGRLTFDHKIRVDAQERGVRLFPKECLG